MEGAVVTRLVRRGMPITCFADSLDRGRVDSCSAFARWLPRCRDTVAGSDLRAVLGRIEGGAGCSVKDSFAVLDLEPHGFHLLFEATWIRRSAVQPTGPATLGWRRVRSAAELEHWSRGHELDAFGPALLDNGDLQFYFSGSATRAGFALNRAGGVVRISNLFAGSADPMVVWSDAVAVATRAIPGVDLAGYELGSDLEFAVALGFVQTGPLRVWMH